jgi:hypothetical protein
MISQTSQVVVVLIALASMPFVAGCNNRTNETGSNTEAGGPPPPNAPKTQKDFFEQQKAAKPAAQPGR